jgi:hypothetical protein
MDIHRYQQNNNTMHMRVEEPKPQGESPTQSHWSLAGYESKAYLCDDVVVWGSFWTLQVWVYFGISLGLALGQRQSEIP